jgi:hypothetical protein
MGRKRRNRQERISKNIVQGTPETIHPKSTHIERQITQAWENAVKHNRSGVTFITPIHNIRHLESAVNRIIPNPIFKGWHIQGFADSGVCGVVLDNGRGESSQKREKMVRESPETHQKSIIEV